METEQFGILTGLMLWQKDGIEHNLNPFYKASKKQVLAELDFAKIVYRDVFKYTFVPGWVIRQAKEQRTVKGNTIQDLLDAGDATSDLIKDKEKMKAIPNYKEMQELVL